MPLAKCIKIEIRTGHFRMNSHENTNNEHFEIFVEQIANKNLSFEKNKNGEKTKTFLFEIKKKKFTFIPSSDAMVSVPVGFRDR